MSALDKMFGLAGRRALVTSKDFDLRGAFRFGEAFAPAVAALQSGRIVVKPLIPNSRPLDQAEQAFRAASDLSSAIKAQIRFS